MRPRPRALGMPLALLVLVVLALAPPAAGQGEEQADLLLRYPTQVTFTVWGEGGTWNEFLVEAAPGDALHAGLVVRVRGGVDANGLTRDHELPVAMLLETPNGTVALNETNVTVGPDASRWDVTLNGTLPDDLAPGRYSIRFHLDADAVDPDPDNNDPPLVPLQIGIPDHTDATFRFTARLLWGPLLFVGLLALPVAWRFSHDTAWMVRMRTGWRDRWESATATWLQMEDERRTRRGLAIGAVTFLVLFALSLLTAGGLAEGVGGILDALFLGFVAALIHLIGGTLARLRKGERTQREQGLDPDAEPVDWRPHLRAALVAAGQTFVFVALFALSWQQLAASFAFFRWPVLADLVRFIVIGLWVGAIYALIALGYTMVYGILKFINFAHGEVFMWGAFFAWIFVTGWQGLFHLSLPMAILVAMLLTGGLGALLERVAYRPLRGGSRLTPLVTAIALSLLLQALAQFFFGATKVQYSQRGGTYAGSPLRDWFTARVELLGTTVDHLAILIFFVSIVLMLALHLFVRHSKLGRAMRATADDYDTARTIGINVDRVISTTFVIGSMLAAIGGIAFGLRFGIEPTMGVFVGIKAFTAAVVGGIGNIYGAFLGGFLIGIAENVGGQFIQSEFQRVITFFILIVFLIFRPQGIFSAGGIDRR